MAYESIASHRTMALDRVRNAAYARALGKVVTPDSVVLDLGAGTGVLGMIAAKLGARRVYLVEPTDVISVAQELVDANGLQDRVVCVHGRIEDVPLPEQADVIVSVMTGNFLVTEDLLPVLFHARDTMLKPAGHLLPDAAVMEATLVSAPDIHDFNIGAWADRHEGIDTSPARPYAANTIYYSSPTIRDSVFLAEPAVIHQIDLTRDDYVGVHGETAFDVARTGTCHGIAGWFRMRLGGEWLSTSPRDPKVHWSAAFLPIDPPLQVEQGERVTFALDRPPRGDWAWRLSARAGSRRHSTLFAMPLTEKTLRKSGTNHVPAPSADARALMHVLAAMDGVQDVTAIARSLHAAFGDRYRTEADALAFTQEVVARYA